MMLLKKSTVAAGIVCCVVPLAVVESASGQRFPRAARAARRVIARIPRPVVVMPPPPPADAIVPRTPLDDPAYLPPPRRSVRYYRGNGGRFEELPAPAPSDERRMQAAYNQFRQADYIATLETLRTILENETNPGEAELLAAHALFGLEAYREAAGALRAALRALSEDRWGEIVSNHRDYFASSAEYDQRLRALERHVARNPRDPNARFLLGYHYGYGGRAADATAELQTAVALNRNDSLAAELLEAVRSEGAGDAGTAEAEPGPEASTGEPNASGPDATGERPEAIEGPAFPEGREF
ncbi:MAG: hypothetical protein WD278_05060 [Pirellulales bacterium]